MSLSEWHKEEWVLTTWGEIVSDDRRICSIQNGGIVDIKIARLICAIPTMLDALRSIELQAPTAEVRTLAHNALVKAIGIEA